MGNSMEEMDIIVIRSQEQPENKGFCFRWNLFDEKAMTGRLLQFPSREQIPVPLQEQLIVELYSK